MTIDIESLQTLAAEEIQWKIMEGMKAMGKVIGPVGAADLNGGDSTTR